MAKKEQTPLERLQKLRAEIEQAKSDRSGLEGERRSVTAGMQEQFGISSLDEAKKKLEELQQQETDLNQQITDGLAELEQQYVWE